MSPGKVAGGLAAAAGVAAAGAAVRVAQQRRRIAQRTDDTPAFGSLRSPARTVIASDGVPLHVEVDPAPQAVGTPTIVFVHGYTLNMDCWHFQREHFRGVIPTVFYDQRSHGRSGRSDAEHATIEQLAEDLLAVMDTIVPDGPVVVIGHSMGGMTIVALAEKHPELFAPDGRVVGVGLISTTAGGLDPAKLLFPLVPARAAASLTSNGLRVLSRGHRAVDSARRLGRSVAIVATDRLAFGGEVPASYVDFVDEMLSSTPFEVVAGFFPHFGSMDKFHAVETFEAVPTTIICGTSDRVTSIGHSRKMHSRVTGSTLVEALGAGHMVILEQSDLVNQALDDLLAAASQ